MSRPRHASEALSEQIVDSLTAGLLVVDLDGPRARSLNPAGHRLLGRRAMPSDRDYREVLAACRALRRADRPSACATERWRRARRDLRAEPRGQVTHLASRVSPLGAPAATARASSACSPTSRRCRELEEQLRLKEALARLGELTAGIAHEFRNGLATIHGYSRLLGPTRCPRPTGRTWTASGRKPRRSATW